MNLDCRKAAHKSSLPLVSLQDSNPRIKSGEIARYTGIGNCFTRVAAEQGAHHNRSLLRHVFAVVPPYAMLEGVPRDHFPAPHRHFGAKLQTSGVTQVWPRSGVATLQMSSGEALNKKQFGRRSSLSASESLPALTSSRPL